MFSEGSDWQAAESAERMCDSCGEESATVHVLRFDGAGISHTHLCQECAEGETGQMEGAALVLALPGALGSLLTPLVGSALTEQDEPFAPLCGACGTTLADLRESGLMGCAACYEVFRANLGDEEPEEGEAGSHLGKVPSRLPGDERGRREILRLQRMLQELVESERFEEAASVRDRLAQIESSMSAGQ
ncbi:MAG: UvrB/UvrC motif-containing protein [Thermoleophilia bacterium]